MKSMETISPDLKNYNITTSCDKYKNVPNFPCAQDYKTIKPRRNTKFTKTGNEIYLYNILIYLYKKYLFLF